MADQGGLRDIFPDTYMCHKMIADRIIRLLPAVSTVIDVGGEGRMNRFLPGITVTNANINNALDGCALPFADGSFDYAVSVNTLEHVSEKKRELFISEALRVASRGALLCFPFDGIMSKVEDLKNSIGHSHPIADNRLPDIDRITEFIGRKLDLEYSANYVMPAYLHLALIAAMPRLTKETNQMINGILENRTSIWTAERDLACTVILEISK